MNLTRTMKRLAPALAVGGAAITLCGAPAQADDWSGWWYNTAPPGGFVAAKARFSQDGNATQVCDIRRDGYKAELNVYNDDDSTYGWQYDTLADGRCTTVRGGVFKLADNFYTWGFRTPNYYKFQVCRTKPGHDKNFCGAEHRIYLR